mmetsp:Transcript_4222/g.9585  ORF Transcript_4222/g.9585 Transcript_4222/m.9585 type:complete len:146 (-) Transcript_4222:46-483(-)
MSEFVRVLRREMEQLPEDFFRDELLSDSFLKSSLTTLCQEAEVCTEAHGEVAGKDHLLFQRRVQRLRKMISQRFGLQIAKGEFDALDALALQMESAQGDEDAPIVVLEGGADTSAGLAAEPESGCETGQTISPSRMEWMMPPRTD